MSQKTRRPRSFSDEEIIKALELHGGIVSRVADVLGTNRMSLHRRISNSVILTQAREDAREIIIDLAEGSLMDLVAKGDRKSVIYVLNTVGQSRGYGQVHRIDHTSSDGTMSPTRDLTDKELRARLQNFGIDVNLLGEDE